MKKRGLIIRFFTLFLFLLSLVGCEIVLPSFDFSNKKTIEDKIYDEYLKLISGDSIEHKKWTFDAKFG